MCHYQGPNPMKPPEPTMPIELTSADVMSLRAIAARHNGPFTADDLMDIYRAGLSAGIERAAQVAMSVPNHFGTLADDSHKECAIVAARLIRALLK